MVYAIVRLIRGTRAAYMLLGLSIAILIYFVSSFAELNTVHWLLSSLFDNILLIIIVVFQSDLRKLLTRIGRAPLLSLLRKEEDYTYVDELIEALYHLSAKKMGALFVIAKHANVIDHLDMGVQIDSKVNKELLFSIFTNQSPIHDGAVVIEKGRVMAAGCFLPLGLNETFNPQWGTRHRAAMSLSKETDALIFVVSEEKGWVSIFHEGKIIQNVPKQQIKKHIIELLNTQDDVVTTEAVIS